MGNYQNYLSDRKDKVHFLEIKMRMENIFLF